MAQWATEAIQLDPQRRRVVFLRAVSLAPSDDLPHAYYAQWLDAHRRSQEAIHQLKIAIALNPQRPLPRELLVGAYRYVGETESARHAVRPRRWLRSLAIRRL